MDSDSAFEALDQVQDMEWFFHFVRALIGDRLDAAEAEVKTPSSPYGPDAGGWENTSIEDYLDCALAWAEDTSMGATQIRGALPS
jgi:hypothetical protein